MSEPELTKDADAPRPSRRLGFLRQKLPYIAVLALAISGVAYTNVSQKPLAGYWEFLALAIGVLYVVSEWENAEDRQARIRLMWRQALHWAAILVTMNIILLSAVHNMLPAPATSLVLLTLLAFGTFLAGVNFCRYKSAFWGLRWLSPCRRSHGSNSPHFFRLGGGIPGWARPGVLAPPDRGLAK